MTTTWHHFTASTVDDSECTNDTCGVIVADEALGVFAVPCPTPPCTAPGQDGEPCVFVPSTGRPVCSYCERTGFAEDDQVDEDLDDDDDAVMVVDAA